MNNHLIWIVLLPLLGAVINGLAGRFAPRSWVSMVAVGSVLGSFLLALDTFLDLRALPGEERILVAHVYEWFSVNLGGREVPVNVRFAFDSLSGLMTLVVTGIATLIHVYSLEYMSEEKSFARFLAYLNLFTASMLILILASNMPLMFVGWEGVGLCSYLLIGFWYENPAYAAAGRKAFVANRIGDFGVLIGMFALVMTSGSFEFDAINSAAPEMAREFMLGTTAIGTVAGFATFFLFLGATGKSAQLPLYVWLPDAMAGPTPVSALIHAATMVTAGVYLTCRLSDVFLMSPTVLTVIAVVGTLTAFIAATIALVQNEMKKILAYSTVSQLGFMFAAVGLGAFASGFFHVFTHAFFKACLFLGAGAVMHAVHAHGDADIFKLGGLKRDLPVVRWTFLASCLAIAGVPLFSGFFSKDEILLAATTVAMTETDLPSWLGWFVAITLTLAATMTAFYMFRLYYLTFTGHYRSGHDHEHGDHEHEHDHGDEHGYAAHPHAPGMFISFVLVVLGIGAVVVGYLGLPHHFAPNWWHEWMEPSVSHLRLSEDAEHAMAPVYLAMALGTLAMAVGIGFATMLYRDKNEDRFTAAMPKGLHSFLFNKWYVDELYEATILRANRAVAVFASGIDKSFVDNTLTTLPAKLSLLSSRLLQPLQSGQVHAYGLGTILGVLGLGYWFTYPHAELAVNVASDGSAVMAATQGYGYTYRFDVDSDGVFDAPVQPGKVRIVLAEGVDATQREQLARVVSAAVAPEAWATGMAALGSERGQRTYELTPPLGEMEDVLRMVAEVEFVETVDVRPIHGQVRFGDETSVESVSYEPSDYVAADLIFPPGEMMGETRIRVGETPMRIGPSLAPAPAGESDAHVPYVWVERNDADGQMRLMVRDEATGEGEPVAVGLTGEGDSHILRGQPIRIVPVVAATVEVRNVFGHVSRERIEVPLERSEAAHVEEHAAVQMENLQ